jgi:hypothetical protein
VVSARHVTPEDVELRNAIMTVRVPAWKDKVTPLKIEVPVQSPIHKK